MKFHYVAQAGIRCSVLLIPIPECWDQKHVTVYMYNFKVKYTLVAIELELDIRKRILSEWTCIYEHVTNDGSVCICMIYMCNFEHKLPTNLP